MEREYQVGRNEGTVKETRPTVALCGAIGLQKEKTLFGFAEFCQQ
jgi:hypothetical protein